MQFKKEPTLVDYCKEAMELHLSKLPTKDIDSIVINLAKLINREINTLDITMNQLNDKGEVYQVRIPAISFLRTDTIQNALIALSIPEAIIKGYINRIDGRVDGKISTEEVLRPKDLDEVKDFIYETLKNKYGTNVSINDTGMIVVKVKSRAVGVGIKLS